MKKTGSQILVLLVLIIAGSTAVTVYVLRNQKGDYRQAEPAREFDHSHSAFDQVLRTHVKNAQVDYKSIKESPANLDAYLEEASTVKESSFETWSEEQQLAFLINLYNAATIRLIIDHYPVESIKDIGNPIITAWKKQVVRVFGEIHTLDHIEHDMIRGQFDEPRIHFALVCAARSCPPLRPEAYTAARLDEQLDDQGYIFLANEEKNYLDLDTGTVHLSKIFDWYGKDFTKDGTPLLEALSKWFPEDDRERIASEDLEVEFSTYDWALNDFAE